MCYHPPEAAWLAELGFDDLLVAYPSVDPQALREVAAQVARGERITLMADHPAQLPALARAAAEAGTRLPVCLDVDMSERWPGCTSACGRSPVVTPPDAVAFYEALQAAGNLELVGVMGYEAQIAGVPDLAPRLKGLLVTLLKSRPCPR